MSIHAAVLQTDWVLLRKQKETLVTLANELMLLEDERYEHLDGIINYLDVIMDAAAEVVGEDLVFGADE